VKKSKTSAFLLELPLAVDAGQARRLRAHFEVARCLYNTLLGEALKRLRQMREYPQWQAARAMPRRRNGNAKPPARSHKVQTARATTTVFFCASILPLISFRVSDPTAKAGGLCLGSTATLRSESAAQLWLHRSTHRG